MDSLDLDVTRERAGGEFLRSLERLGLQPEALFWAFDCAEDRFVLVLATELFDLKGPLAVYDLLVRAYRASALPREIDPFVIRLHSPEHRIIRSLDRYYSSTPEHGRLYGLDPDGPDLSAQVTAFVRVEVEGVQFRTDWVYRFLLPKRRDFGAVKREWRRFQHEVERLAA